MVNVDTGAVDDDSIANHMQHNLVGVDQTQNLSGIPNVSCPGHREVVPHSDVEADIAMGDVNVVSNSMHVTNNVIQINEAVVSNTVNVVAEAAAEVASARHETAMRDVQYASELAAIRQQGLAAVSGAARAQMVAETAAANEAARRQQAEDVVQQQSRAIAELQRQVAEQRRQMQDAVVTTNSRLQESEAARLAAEDRARSLEAAHVQEVARAFSVGRQSGGVQSTAATVEEFRINRGDDDFESLGDFSNGGSRQEHPGAGQVEVPHTSWPTLTTIVPTKVGTSASRQQFKARVTER